jgi:hypothetical protein
MIQTWCKYHMFLRSINLPTSSTVTHITFSSYRFNNRKVKQINLIVKIYLLIRRKSFLSPWYVNSYFRWFRYRNPYSIVLNIFLDWRVLGVCVCVCVCVCLGATIGPQLLFYIFKKNRLKIIKKIRPEPWFSIKFT